MAVSEVGVRVSVVLDSEAVIKAAGRKKTRARERRQGSRGEHGRGECFVDR